MAAIGVALWKYVMRYAPHTPTYFNRDRFVLSNGESQKAPEILVFFWLNLLTELRPYLSVSVFFLAPHRL